MKVRSRENVRAPALGLCGLFCLAGCTVGPSYHRPPVPIPPAYRGAPPPGSGEGADLAWWHIFGDPVLAELIRKARADNPDVRVAAARVEVVQAEFAALRASFGPQVNAQANDTLQRISPIGLPRDRTTGDPAGSASFLTGTATWEIDFWGKYRRANEAARATLLAGDAARDAVLTSLVATLASAYFDLLALDQQGHIAQESIDDYERMLELTRQRKKMGVASRAEEETVRQKSEYARQAMAGIGERSTQRENEIRTLLGENPGAVPRGKDLWAETLPDVAPGLPSQLLERRPDLREAEQKLIAANAEIGVAQAAYFPNIRLTAAGGLESTAFHNLFTPQAETWLLQPALNLPIFTYGRIRAQVGEAKAQRGVLIAQYVGTVQGAFRDVADALAYRKRAAEQMAAQRVRTEAAGDVAALAERRRAAGVSSAVEALQEEQLRLAAQSDLAASRNGELEATVSLYRALGGGWKP